MESNTIMKPFRAIENKVMKYSLVMRETIHFIMLVFVEE